MLRGRPGSIEMLLFPTDDDYHCRSRVEGRGKVGEGPLQGLQQAHQAGAEHDTEGPSRLRTGFHSAH